MTHNRIHKAAAICVLTVAILGTLSNAIEIIFISKQIAENNIFNFGLNISCLLMSILCLIFKNKVTFYTLVAAFYLAGGAMIYLNEMASIVGEFMVFAGFFILFRSKERRISFPIAGFTIIYTFVLKVSNANQSGELITAIVFFLLVLIGFTFIIYIDTQFIDHRQSQADVYKNLLKKESQAFARGRQIISVNAGLSGVVQIPDYIALLKRAYNEGERERVNDLIECLEIATKENARRVHAIRNFILTTDDDEIVEIEVNSFFENMLHLLEIEGKLFRKSILKEFSAQKCAYFNPNVLRKFIELVLEPSFQGESPLRINCSDEVKGCRITIECIEQANSTCFKPLPQTLTDKMTYQGAIFDDLTENQGRISVILPTSDWIVPTPSK